MIRALVISAFLLLAAGCNSGGSNAKVFRLWGCDNESEFRSMLKEYSNIVMVCVTADRWEDNGPNVYARHHYVGSVVRVYKGDWKVSERIAFWQGLDYRAPTNPVSAAGNIYFVLTSGQKGTNIFVDTGELHYYDPERAPAIEYAFPITK